MIRYRSLRMAPGANRPWLIESDDDSHSARWRVNISGRPNGYSGWCENGDLFSAGDGNVRVSRPTTRWTESGGFSRFGAT
jgi:hypothetical protein